MTRCQKEDFENFKVSVHRSRTFLNGVIEDGTEHSKQGLLIGRSFAVQEDVRRSAFY